MALPMDTPTEIHGARVTLMDANHCPGAVLLLFELSNGRSVLHTGDFRYEPSMLSHPALLRARAAGSLDTLYLDTTYCDPRWTFPDRDVACEAMAEIVRRELRREPRTLFLVGSYAVGKERAVRAVARAARSCSRLWRRVTRPACSIPPRASPEREHRDVDGEHVRGEFRD